MKKPHTFRRITDRKYSKKLHGVIWTGTLTHKLYTAWLVFAWSKTPRKHS